MSLVAAAVEREGISTTCVMLLREIAEVLRPPRALVVPFPFGYPLGAPDDAALQHRVIDAALALLPRGDVPVLEELGAGS